MYVRTSAIYVVASLASTSSAESSGALGATPLGFLLTGSGMLLVESVVLVVLVEEVDVEEGAVS